MNYKNFCLTRDHAAWSLLVIPFASCFYLIKLYFSNQDAPAAINIVSGIISVILIGMSLYMFKKKSSDESHLVAHMHLWINGINLIFILASLPAPAP